MMSQNRGAWNPIADENLEFLQVPSHPTPSDPDDFQVLTDDDQEKEAKLKKHIKAFQGEQSPLSDSATSFGGKPRSPSSPPKSFIPVGHISLDSEYENPELGVNEE